MILYNIYLINYFYQKLYNITSTSIAHTKFNLRYLEENCNLFYIILLIKNNYYLKVIREKWQTNYFLNEGNVIRL